MPTRTAISSDGIRHALSHPDNPPAEAALPHPALPWRAFMPVLGPVMTMLDSTTDAISNLFMLRKPTRLQREAAAAHDAEMAGPSGAQR